MKTALTIFSVLFSFLAMAAAVFFYSAYQDEVPEVRREGERAVSEIKRDGDRAVSRVGQDTERVIARLQANNQSLVESYEAEIARLRAEYDGWRATESRRYLHAVGDLKDETELVLDGLKGEVERLREDAIAASVSAARSEWIEAEQLAAKVVAAADGFDSRIDAALAKVDAAAFASAQPKVDALDSRTKELAALQQDIEETVDAIYELCSGEKCGTVISIEAWTTTPATTLNAKRAAFAPNGTRSLTVADVTVEHRYGETYTVELEQLDVSPFGRPLAKLPNESDRIVGAYRIRVFQGNGSKEPVDVSLAPNIRFPSVYSLVTLDASREWRMGQGRGEGVFDLGRAAFHKGEGFTIALVRSE